LVAGSRQSATPDYAIAKPGLSGQAEDLITNRRFIFLEAWGGF